MMGKENLHIPIGDAERIEITTVIDNYSDHTLAMTETPSEMIKRASWAMEERIPDEALLAEHGLSLLVKVFKGDKHHSILLDAGWSRIGVPHNMRMLGINASRIEAVVISHGHMDHFGALLEILWDLVSPDVPLIIHPDAFLPRVLSLSSGKRIKMPRLDEGEVENADSGLIKTKRPHPLASGLVFSLGEVERNTDFEKGLAGALIERKGEWEPDLIMDDQGLVMNIKGKGLVVITGCAHAGIINTIRHARKITGINTVYAVMGGFHLTGPQFMPITERMIQELKKINPSVIVPMHCTCWRATNLIAEEFPDQFILNSVGTTFSF